MESFIMQCFLEATLKHDLVQFKDDHKNPPVVRIYRTAEVVTDRVDWVIWDGGYKCIIKEK